MRKYFVSIAITLAVLCVNGNLRADTSTDIRSLLQTGLIELKTYIGDPNLCVITDATYVILNGKTTEKYVDVIREETGCTIGKGNLLFVHRRTDYPLKIFIFKKDTKDCFVIRHDGQKTKGKKTNIDIGKTVDSASWEKTQTDLGVSDAYSILIIANAWAAGIPHDFLKCAEFHNHICPGVTSGYCIAKFIQKMYPLKKGESYMYVSCPPWCKDDGIQILMDITPGKRGFFVKQLTDEQKEALEKPDVAGIMVIKGEKGRGGKALVLSFNWDKANELSGAGNLDGLRARLQMITGIIPYLEKPELFVRVLKEYTINAERITRLTLAGVNPYEELGFVK